ncbi:MAG: PLDc N-terminal domain-containing protein [Nanoarchaeota archaeon]
MITQLFGLIGLLCAVWVIYDVFAVRKRMATSERIIWTVCAILFSILTAIVYYFVRKK